MKTIASNYDRQVDIARGLFLSYDQEGLIRKYALSANDQWIRLSYLNTPFRICRKDGRLEELTGDVWTECRRFNTVLTIYDLLCHHQGLLAPVLSGQWCSVGNFVVTGVQNTVPFTNSFAARWDGRVEHLRAACEALGGRILPPLAGADLTCRFDVTHFFPVLFQFWSGDEDFPPSIKLLWDRNTPEFLLFETTFYLQGDLLSRLAACDRPLSIP